VRPNRDQQPGRHASTRLDKNAVADILAGGVIAPEGAYANGVAYAATDESGQPTQQLGYYLSQARRLVRESLARPDERDGGTRYQKDDISLGDLMEMDLPPPEWVFPGVMNKRAVVVVGAEPKVGKTFHCLNAMLAISANGRLYDQEDLQCVSPGSVFVFCLEDELVHVRARVTAMMHGLSVEQRAAAARNMRILPRQRANLLEEEDVVELVARVLRHQAVSGRPARAVYVDPFMKAFDLEDENSSVQVEKAMKMLHLLKDVLDCTVLFVHHAGKGGADKRGGQALRGSTAFHSNIDGGWYLRKVHPDDTTSLAAVVTFETKNGKALAKKFVEPVLTDDDRGYVKRVEWTFEEPSEENGGLPKSAEKRGGEKKGDAHAEPRRRVNFPAARERTEPAPERRPAAPPVVGPSTPAERVVSLLRAAGGQPHTLRTIHEALPRIPLEAVRRALDGLVDTGVVEETVAGAREAGASVPSFVIAGAPQQAQLGDAHGDERWRGAGGVR